MRWEEIQERAARMVGFLVKKERIGLDGSIEKPGKEELYGLEKFKDSNIIYENLSQREQYDYRRAFLKLNRRNAVRKVLRYSAAAASAAIFIGGILFAGYEYVWRPLANDTSVADYSNIKPIEKRARLILADGMEVDIKAVGEAVVE